MKKKLLSLLLCLCMVLGLLPAMALAEGAQITTALDFSSATADQTGTGYTWANSSKTLTINGLNLNVTDSNALTLPAGSTLVLNGSNTITSTGNFGINMPKGNVTVEGTGSLTVSGQSAGIYTNGEVKPFKGITINSGKITAIATSAGNGINSVNGSIDIAGGVVTALGKLSYGYGIKGSGVNITGGYVYANGVKMGTGTNLHDAQPTGGIVFNAATIDTSGNVTSKGAGSFCGSATLTENMTLQADESLSFSVNSTLSFAEGITLTLAGGTVGLKSDLDVTDYSGKIIGNGTIYVGDTPYTVKDGTIIVPKATLTAGTPTVGVTTATIPLTTDGTKLYYTNSWGSALSALKIKSEVGSHVQADCNLGTVKIGTDKSLSLTGLTQGRSYTYYLVAENAGGYLSDVVRVDFKTLLPTPEATDFSVTGLEGGTIYSYTSEIQITVQAANGVTGVGGATLCYKKQNADGSYGALQTGQPQDVGTYKLYAKVVAGASYAAVDELDLNETVTITKGTLTATMLQLSANSFLYDGEVKKPTVSLSSAHSGAGTFTTKYYSDSKCTAEVSEPKEVGTYYVGVTATEGTNFNAVTMPLAIAFEIRPVANSITSLTCADICYGERPDPKAVATYPTDFTYTYSKEKAGSYTSTLPNSVGTWWVKVTAAATGTCASAEQTTSFQVKKMPLTPYVVSVTSRAYDGTTDGSGSLWLKDKSGNTIASESARASGTFTWTSANAGTSTVDVSNIKLDFNLASNYELSTTSLENVTAPNDVSIEKRKIWASIGRVTKPYDGTTDVPENALTVSFDAGAVSSGDTVAVTVSGTFDRTDVGDGTVTLGTPTVTGTNAENYEIIMPRTVNGTINRRHVLVTVNPGQGKVYGQADPVLTYTVTAADGLTGGGLIGGDTIPYAPVRAAGEAAGSYEITRGAIPDFYYNYAIDGFTGGTFTISKAVVTASADSKTMTVGGTLPAFTVSYAGIVSGDTADGIFATKSTAACTADGKTAGTYDISVTTPVLKTEATKNYTVGSSVGGTLTVSNPAPVAPGGSTDTGTKVTVPVSSGEGNVKVEATVKDGTAAVTLTDAQITEIASGKSDTGTVKLDVSSLDVKAATIPAKVIAAADKSGNTDGIQVALPTGTVTLDKTALAAVSDKGGDVTVSVGKVDNAKLTETQKAVLGSQAGTALVVDVTVLASGEKVSAFNGGSIGVAVPYTPKASEDTGKLVVWFINDDGSIEPKTGSYNAKTGKFEFQTQHLSQYVLVSFPFKDVSASSWYYGSVAYAYMNGLFSGTGSTAFSPNRTMTRGMLVTALWRMAGKPAASGTVNFTDVPASAYCAEAVRWAAANKIVGGYGHGSFAPNDTVTRQQMAAILYRYASVKGYDVSSAAALDGFADSTAVSDYAKSAFAWAVNGGLVKGSDNKLMPGSGATRAQVAAILQRFAQKIVK